MSDSIIETLNNMQALLEQRRQNQGIAIPSIAERLGSIFPVFKCSAGPAQTLRPEDV
jgi:hypothetical protein